MIGTILTTLGGLGMGIFKGISENKKKEAERKQAIEVLREERLIEKERLDASERMQDKENASKILASAIIAGSKTTISAHRNDESIQVSGNMLNRLLNLYRGSVRPTTAYMFDALYLWVIIFFVTKTTQIFNQMPPDNATYLMLKDFVLTILSRDFWAIFGGIIGFYFGHRVTKDN